MIEDVSYNADLSITAGVMEFSGDDVVALRKFGTIIDVIGQIGVDPGSTWAGTCSTQGNSLRRITSIGVGDNNGNDTFTTDTEWTCTTSDNISNLGIHTVNCETGPEIAIQGNANIITDGSTATAAGNNTFFGSVNVLSGTIVKSFTILNTGTNTLILSENPSISGVNSSNFTVTLNPNLTIASGSSANFEITFNPSVVGTRNAIVSILNNDVDEATFTFNIQGTGSLGAVDCATLSGVTLFSQNFESTPASPTLTYTSTNTTVSSGVGLFPASSMFSTGLQGIKGNTDNAAITFNSIDVSNYSNIDFTFKLAAFSGTAGNGMEVGDYIKVFISVDGGPESEELIVTGSPDNNAYWSFLTVVNTAVSAYSGANPQNTFSPSGSGLTTSNPYGTVTITDLPNTSDLRIRIEIKRNSSSETWVIDDAQITGDTASLATWDGVWSGTALANNVKIIFDDDFNMISQPSISACECEIKAGKTVTISADKYLKIENNIINNGTIIIEDSGNLLQVSDISSITGTGNYIVRRNTTSLLSRFVFTYWSSPLTSSTLAEIAPDASLYYSFNASTQSWQGANAATAMTPGVGYITQGRNVGITYPNIYSAEFTGSNFNNGEISVEVSLGESSTNGADDNWNLIGNPYPSAIDANLLLSENENLNGTIYFWTHNTDASTTANFTQEDYVSWNGTGGTANCSGCVAPTNLIASGQGFFAQALSDSPIVFNNSIRVGEGNNNFYRETAATTEDKIWLNLSSSTSFKQILVGFLENATDDIDRLYDGEKIDGNANANFYSIIHQKPFVIQGKSPLKEYELIPLDFSANVTGDFTINIEKIEGYIENSNVFIEDSLLNIKHNLKNNEYVFSVPETGTYNTRFKLVIETASEVLNVENIGSENKLIIGNDSNSLFLRTTDNSIIKEVSIYNLLGKELYSKTVSSAVIEITSSTVKSNTILILKTVLENGEQIINKIYKN